MAGKTKTQAPATSTGLRGFWSEQIEQAKRRYGDFNSDGDNVVGRYRLERENNKVFYQDKYNILYSTTETMKPSLYAQTPKVQAVNRHKDRDNDNVSYAVMLMEAATQYGLEEIDFDAVMENVIEDYLLPGLGQAWVRYDPQFTKMGEGADEYEALTLEGLAVDYVNRKDFLSDDVAIWAEKRWVARRVYFGEKKAKARFGEEKARTLQYTHVQSDDAGKSSEVSGKQAMIWEIWDKEEREAIWFSPDATELLDKKSDPLKLKDFFPCPRPLRAIRTTNTFVPKAFYSEYKAQAETLDDITQRIRILTKALRVIGVYDASQTQLAKLLVGNDNRMVPIEDWTQFAGQGGIDGAIQWMPIKDIAAVLAELYKQREIAKNEIYEITGFSDIVRGVSKASETLGAQEIKNNWATGRLRSVQKEVQRFCRDLIRMLGEIIVEHFDEASLAMYCGFEPPEVSPEEQQAAAQYGQAMAQFQQQGLTLGGEPPQQPPPTKRQQALEQFKAVVKLLKTEKQRCALIGIETDSTIMPDEAAERKDRMEFLGAAGAFMQQAGPMAMQYPEMRGLLGSMLMFAIRTFRASRPLEKDFEDFSKAFANAPSMPPPGSTGEGGGSDPHAAQAQVDGEKIKAEAADKLNTDKLQMEKYKIDTDAQIERDRLQQDHEYRMAQLQLESKKIEQAANKVILDANAKQADAQRADEQQAHAQDMDADGADRADRQLEADREAAAAKPKAGDKSS